MNKIKEDAINLHRALRGKIEIHTRSPLTQALKEAIGNHIPKPLKDGTKTRQLNSKRLVRRVEYVQVSSQP